MSGINTSATVLHINKPEGAQVWAGASKQLAGNLDLASLGSVFELKVWSPRAGVPIFFKLEDVDSPPDADGNPSIIAQITATTTVANAWEILTFDLSEDVANYSIDNEYDQVVIFPDNGNMGVAGGESFYFDDIKAVEPPFPTIPISFEDPEINYVIGGFGAADFGPIPTEVTTNPDMSGANTSATVGHINKTEGAQVWAGAFIPLNGDIDLATLGGVYEMKVWSPRVGVPINFKVEDLSSPPDANGAPSIFAETTVMTTTSNEWEVMTFDNGCR